MVDSSSVIEFSALVPMKGHSERIPRKNLRAFGGRPLCTWILETLSAVEQVKAIVVNTDSSEIAEIVSGFHKVTVHHRPPELCGDDVSMNRILAFDLAQLPRARHFIQSHCTNPLLTAATVSAALERYSAGLERFDSLFAVTRHQARFFTASGTPLNHDPRTLLPTQQLDPVFEENSNFYIFSRESFENAAARIGVRPQLMEVSKLEAVDIDIEEDWVVAEALHACRR